MARFSGPIPGQSLTREPGKYAWERPPEIVDPEQVVQLHLMRLSEEDRMQTILDALEFGVTDLYTLVKGMMRAAVSQGVHTIETGMLAAPVVHMYIKKTADAAGIEYNDGINEGSEREQAQKVRAAEMAKKKLKDLDMEEPVMEAPEEVMMEEMPEEPVQEEQTRGLMARGGM